VPALVHGQYLLFDSYKTLPGDSSQPQEWVIKPDGTGSKMIAQTAALGPMSPPRFYLDGVWSHNGAVVHLTKYPGACVPHLSDLPIVGGPEVPKATVTNHDWNFLWSPNDSQVVYLHFNPQDEICEQNGDTMERDLAIMNANGSGKRTIRTNIPYMVTGWLPNASALVGVNDAGAYFKVSLTDGSTTSLGFTADGVPDTISLHGREAKVSPNGSYIAYVKGGHLHVRAMSGATDKDLGAANDFSWRPDSASLAVCSGHLAVVNASTGVANVIYNFAVSKPTWSPDGSRIAFVKTSGGGIYVVGASGGVVKPMPGTSKAREVYWQP
jgi:dipeptidyl aminopeptidase/acylaminoacyl peptidase